MSVMAKDKGVENEVPPQDSVQPKKRPLQEISNTTAKKRKESQQEMKATKAARIAAADHLARAIFKVQKPDICMGCTELRRSIQLEQEEAKHALEVKNAEILEMSTKLQDMSSAMEAKKLVIKNLEDKLQRAELENAHLKKAVEKPSKVSQQGTVIIYSSGHRKVPVPFALNGLITYVPLPLRSRCVCVAFALHKRCVYVQLFVALRSA